MMGREGGGIEESVKREIVGRCGIGRDRTARTTSF